MGLMIHSLEVLSKRTKRDYFIYLLDFNWDEPVINIIQRNFKRLAEWASKNNAAIITGVGDVGHFDNEVLSYHSINGERASNILPAILITKTNPHIFRKYSDKVKQGFDKDFNCMIIPLRKIGATESNILDIIAEIIQDVEEKKDLEDFSVNGMLKIDLGKAIASSVMIEPNVAGLGFNLKNFVVKLRKKSR